MQLSLSSAIIFQTINLGFTMQLISSRSCKSVVRVWTQISWSANKTPTLSATILLPKSSTALLGSYCCFWTVTKYSQHKIYYFNHFKMYSSVSLSTFILLGNHHHYSPLELFSSSQTKNSGIIKQNSLNSSPLPPGNYSTFLSLWIWLF